MNWRIKVMYKERVTITPFYGGRVDEHEIQIAEVKGK